MWFHDSAPNRLDSSRRGTLGRSLHLKDLRVYSLLLIGRPTVQKVLHRVVKFEEEVPARGIERPYIRIVIQSIERERWIFIR